MPTATKERPTNRKPKPAAPKANGTWDEWIEEGPFRKWRLSHTPKIGQHRAAMRCGVVLGTIQAWERGSWLPNDENFETLAKVMHAKSAESLKTEWLTWHTRGRDIESRDGFSS